MTGNADLLPAHAVLADVENTQPVIQTPADASRNDTSTLKGMNTAHTRSGFEIRCFGHDSVGISEVPIASFPWRTSECAVLRICCASSDWHESLKARSDKVMSRSIHATD